MSTVEASPGSIPVNLSDEQLEMLKRFAAILGEGEQEKAVGRLLGAVLRAFEGLGLAEGHRYSFQLTLKAQECI